MKQKSRIPLKPLQSGQIWQMEDSNLHIELVGKRLVHYKLFRGNTKRTAISLSGIGAVEEYLKENKAILVQAYSPFASNRPQLPKKSSPARLKDCF